MLRVAGGAGARPLRAWLEVSPYRHEPVLRPISDFEELDVTQTRCTIVLTGLPQQVFADGPHERLGQFSMIGDVHERRIALTEGQRLSFDAVEFSLRARWELTGPSSQTVFGTISGSLDVEVPASGTYQLRLFATGTNTSTYGFAIAPTG